MSSSRLIISLVTISAVVLFLQTQLVPPRIHSGDFLANGSFGSGPRVVLRDVIAGLESGSIRPDDFAETAPWLLAPYSVQIQMQRTGLPGEADRITITPRALSRNTEVNSARVGLVAWVLLENGKHRLLFHNYFSE